MSALDEYKENRWSRKDKVKFVAIILLIIIVIYAFSSFYKNYIVQKIHTINSIAS